MIARALTGTWKQEQVYVLQQALALYDAYTAQIAACDAQIEARLSTMESRAAPDAPLPDLSPAKPSSNSKSVPAFKARAHYARLLGVDLVAVTGLSGTIAQTIISEIGTDMSRFPTVKQFCSWLGLVPRNDISGGKVLRSRTGKVVSRANQAFRMAAQAVRRTDTALGAYYRSMGARKGPQQAIVAPAHKIARTVYHLLKYGEAFEEERAEVYEEKRRQQELHRLARRAEKLGCTRLPSSPHRPLWLPINGPTEQVSRYVNDHLGLGKPSLEASILGAKLGQLLVSGVTRGEFGAGLLSSKGLEGTLTAQLAPL